MPFMKETAQPRIPLYLGKEIRCYRVNGRGGKRLLIEAGDFAYTLEELKVLLLACNGKTLAQTDSLRGTDGSRNMRYRLRKRNNGTHLTRLYENARHHELVYPFVIEGLESLLKHDKARYPRKPAASRLAEDMG